MREFAKIAPQYWIGDTGRKVRRLGRDVQVLALYLISAPTANAMGLYYLPLAIISHETGIPMQGALKGLRKLSEVGFCSYDSDSEWVFVPKMAKFQIGEKLEPGDKRIKWLNREIESLRKSPFFNDFLNIYREVYHLQGISPFDAPLKGHPGQESEIESETETEREKEKQPHASALLFDDDVTKTKKPNLYEHWLETILIPAFPLQGVCQIKPALRFLRKTKPDQGQLDAFLKQAEQWKPVWTGGGYYAGLHTFLTEGKYREAPVQLRPSTMNGNGKPTMPLPPTMDELVATKSQS